MMAHQARRGHHVPQQHCQRHLICTPPIHILLKDKVGEVPENDDGSVLTGCRKEKGVTKFYDRTAGVLALVRPCGVIVNTTAFQSTLNNALLACCLCRLSGEQTDLDNEFSFEATLSGVTIQWNPPQQSHEYGCHLCIVVSLGKSCIITRGM